MTRDEASKLMVLVNRWRANAEWLEEHGLDGESEEAAICAHRLHCKIGELLKASGEEDGS